MPELFDNNSIEQWSADGEKEITQRALETARAMLSEYQEPKLDKACAVKSLIRRYSFAPNSLAKSPALKFQ